MTSSKINLENQYIIEHYIFFNIEKGGILIGFSI